MLSLRRWRSVCHDSEARLSFLDGSINAKHLSGCFPAIGNSDLILSSTEVRGRSLLDFLASETSTNIIIQSNEAPHEFRRLVNQFVISSFMEDLYTSISEHSVQYVWSIGWPRRFVTFFGSHNVTSYRGTNLEWIATDFDARPKLLRHSINSLGSPCSSRDFKLVNSLREEPESEK